MNSQEALNAVIKICDIHAFRLERALINIKPLIPIQAEKIMHFSDQEFSFLELLTSRFSKLQDIIGSKVFPLILRILEEDRESFSLLDRLPTLEKLNFLPTTKKWIEMRELRNHITHEYPDAPELAAQNLNKAIDQSQELLMYWIFLKDKINTHAFFKA